MKKTYISRNASELQRFIFSKIKAFKLNIKKFLSFLLSENIDLIQSHYI